METEEIHQADTRDKGIQFHVETEETVNYSSWYLIIIVRCTKTQWKPVFCIISRQSYHTWVHQVEQRKK